MSDPQLPDEHLVRGALEARAATATVDPDAWNRLEQARGRPSRRPTLPPGWTGRPLLAVAAAAAAVLLVVAIGITGAQTASRLDMSGGRSQPTEPPGPEQVVTGAEEPAPPATTPGTTPGTTAPAVTETPVDAFADLRNAVYPSTLCPERALRMPGDTFRLVDGEAFAAPAAPGSIMVSIGESVVADLDGDGRREAVARFMCGAMNSDWLTWFVAVLHDGANGLEVLATRTASGAAPTAQQATVADDRTEAVVMRTVQLNDAAARVSLADGGLVAVTWDQNDGFGSEVGSFEQSVTYRWTGRELAVERIGERRRVSPDRFGTEHYAIRRAGVRSMTLPITRVCADVFTPAGPLPDVTLVNGSAPVPGAGGAGQDGLVSIEDVLYAPVSSFDGPEEAIISARCERPGLAVNRAAVVRLVGGRPEVVDVVPTPKDPGDPAMPVSLVGMTARPDRGAFLLRYREAVGSEWHLEARWDGSHLRSG